MRVKTILLFMAAFFVLTLPMAFTIGSVEANDSIKTIQGVVTLVDSCSDLVFIDDVPYSSRGVDLSGMIGAYVKATYSETARGKVIKSIQVIRGGEKQ